VALQPRRKTFSYQNLLLIPSLKEIFIYYICYKALNRKLTANCEQANMRKKGVAYFKVLGAAGKQENSRPG
jgi:hypothetical protein